MRPERLRRGARGGGADAGVPLVTLDGGILSGAGDMVVGLEG